MARVLVASDQPMVRNALCGLLRNSGHTVVAEVENAREAASQVRETRPDLLVLDTNLNALNVLRRVQSQQSNARTVLYGDPSVHYVGRCYEAGADAFVGRHEEPSEFNRAVAAVLSGHRYFPDFDASHQSTRVETRSADGEEHNALSTLSDREVTVLRLLALGHSNIVIAKELSISEKTVSAHRSHLRKKLHVDSFVDMLDLAREHGLVSRGGSPVAAPSESFAPSNDDVLVLRAMLDGTPFPVHVRDREGRLVACNAAFETVHGRSFEALNGKRLIDVDWFPADVAQAMHQRYIQRAASGEAIRMDTEVMMHGRRAVLHHWARPFRGENGDVIGMVCGSADITGREDLARALWMERDHAEANSASQAKLFEEVMDELNPLVESQLEQLRAMRARAEGSVRNEDVEGTLRTCLLLSNLIKSLEDLAELGGGTSTLVAERSKVGVLTREAIEATIPGARDSGSVVHFHWDSNVDPDVVLDSRRYKATVKALLRGALSRAEGGCVEVSLKLAHVVGSLVEATVILSETAKPNQRDASAVDGGMPSDVNVCRRLADLMKGTLRRTISADGHPVTTMRLLLPTL